jgi:hypothetical protein
MRDGNGAESFRSVHDENDGFPTSLVTRVRECRTPDPSVSADVEPVNDAPAPIDTDTLTLSWLTAFPPASLNWTAGGVPKALPLATGDEGAVATVSCVAAPAPSEIGPEVTLGTPLDEKSSV